MSKRKSVPSANASKSERNKKRVKENDDEVVSSKVWFGFPCSHCPKTFPEDNDTVRRKKHLQRLVLCSESTYNKKNKGLSL